MISKLASLYVSLSALIIGELVLIGWVGPWLFNMQDDIAFILSMVVFWTTPLIAIYGIVKIIKQIKKEFAS